MSNLDPKDSETKILKEEMKFHLYDKISDLIKEGYTKEESIDIAIKSFGDENSVKSDIKTIIKSQSKYTNILKRIALFIFLLGFILKALSVFELKKEQNQFWVDYGPTSNTVIDSIANEIKNKESLDEASRTSIVDKLNSFNNEFNNGIHHLTISKGDNVVFDYKKNISEDLKGSGSGGTYLDNGFTITYADTLENEFRSSLAYNSYDSIDEISNSLHYVLDKLGFVFICSAFVMMIMYYIQDSILKEKLTKSKIIILSIETFIFFFSIVSDKDIISLLFVIFLILNLILEKLALLKLKSTENATVTI
ncbi:permease prefix domain 1-containing protein [Clostridium chrysemydis]|uniref:permease prefix domain 1-containing protein n=1 Tax=Clostridium chrysemydis TaxID=2665504 RepID=UPI0018835FF5|nr:permease prefix domain 1-containing protein [Clostridium chrysemydis]